MKISANEAQARMNLLSIVPRTELQDVTRAKVILTIVECEKVLNAFTKDANAAIEKAQPEGYAERYQKYAAAINPTDENRAEAEKQSAEEGFEAFKAEYDQVKADADTLTSEYAKKMHEADMPHFAVEDFADIARLFPSGGKTEIMGKQEENDAILHDIIFYLK